jgi:hypothetical protein
MSEDQADQGEKQAHAVASFLARGPLTQPDPSGSTQWVESDGNKTDPHSLYR